MYKVVLLRHGESTWNKENRFTGWTDVDLSEKGVPGGPRGRPGCSRRKATSSTSPTPRCSSAPSARCGSSLDEMDLMWIPVHHSWRLNERHYGALQGLNKAETAAKYGEEQVQIWRRSYDIPPPALDRGRSALSRPAIRATRDLQPGGPAADRVPEGHRRALPALLARDASRPAIRVGQARASSPPTATACGRW